VLGRLRNPSSFVPQHHRAAAIFSLGDRPLESTIIEWMVLDVHGQALFIGIDARALRHSPALENAVELEPEVPVQPRRVVLLDDEAIALALELSPARLLRLREVALAVVGLDVERNAAGHGYALLRAGVLSGSFFFAVGFFAAALFGLLPLSLPRFSSPRLF